MNVSEIKDAICSEIVAHNCYLVDVSVSKDNDIEITIEAEEGRIELDTCVAISRFFETKFDREQEDYSLTVTSAGLDQPFKEQQYLTNHSMVYEQDYLYFDKTCLRVWRAMWYPCLSVHLPNFDFATTQNAHLVLQKVGVNQ